MSAEFLSGGQNRMAMFIGNLADDNSGYEIQDKLTGTKATTPTKANAALEIVGSIESTKPQIQDTGLVDVEFDQYECEDIWPFLDIMAVPASASTLPDVTLEDGIKKTNAATTDIAILVSYLFYNEDKSKIFVYIIPANVDKTSGSFETAGEGYIKPTFKLKGISVPVADLVVPKACLDETLLTLPSTDITIAKGKGFWRGFIPVAA